MQKFLEFIENYGWIMALVAAIIVVARGSKSGWARPWVLTILAAIAAVVAFGLILAVTS